MKSEPIVIRKDNFPQIKEYVEEKIKCNITDYDILLGTEKDTIVVICLNKYVSQPVILGDYLLWMRGRKIMKIYGRIKTTEV